ncbi:MAG TPA: carboxypeptidase-like regulatory domain-containing protein [Pyrinomonadaceae bacterium]|nr:carboxypeptidase-like regulatory domain-containing protein [Pyrinomonadaceae bacterium]
MLNRFVVVVVCFAAVTFTGCIKKSGPQSATESNGQAAPVEGVEKVKPAPGTGNVQGKVLYNGKPVENIDVRLCETFSRFLSGCGGKIYTAKTDKDGDFVITNVPPKEYEGLTVRVFDTDSYVFATTGLAGISATKYNVVADKTLFVAPTHLFKGDLKPIDPKAGSTVSAQNLELKWEPYPDAAYYKLTLYPDDHSITPPYINERVDGSSFKINKPLEKGTYRWTIEAYNSSDRKLSETPDDYRFTIN